LANETNVEIEEFIARLNEWRRNRKGGGRSIPRPLLCEAGRLAAAHGIGIVARAAGLNYGRVKACLVLKAESTFASRVVAAETTRPGRAAESPFVEVPISWPPAVAKSMVVEVRSARGDFIRIEGGTTTDVATLVSAIVARSA